MDPTRFSVVRIMADGPLDATFGAGGSTETEVSGAQASAIALTPDGRIVVAGRTAAGEAAVAVYFP